MIPGTLLESSLSQWKIWQPRQPGGNTRAGRRSGAQSGPQAAEDGLHLGAGRFRVLSGRHQQDAFVECAQQHGGEGSDRLLDQVS